MNTSILRFRLPAPFDFRATAYSHGWVVLAPNSWDDETEIVERVLRLDSGTVVRVKVWATGTRDHPGVRMQVVHNEPLSRQDKAAIKAAIGRMLRIDETFESFYSLCRTKGEPWTRLTTGAGRLLRSPTLFEDIVKTICTTNIQWGGTKSMVRYLVDAFGDPLPGEPQSRAFPTPEAIASAGIAELANARLGYRAPYIQTAAQQVVSGELDLPRLEDPDLPTDILRAELLAIKGVGNYAANTLLMLLGRYGYLAYDTAMRDFVARKYCSGRQPTEREALEFYADWGEWKYLAYWFDTWSEE